MPRLKQIPRGEAAPEALEAYQQIFGDRDPVAEPGTRTGTPGNWWTVWANAPDVLRHARQGFALIRGMRITPYQRELGLTRAGFLKGSQFVFSQHSKAARNAGIPPEKVAALPYWHSSDLFDREERILLAYTDELVLQDGRVQDATFEQLREIFDDEQILQFTYAVCTYALHATISRALRLEYDDIDERVVEIPAPGEGADVDIMAAIGKDSAS